LIAYLNSTGSASFTRGTSNSHVFSGVTFDAHGIVELSKFNPLYNATTYPDAATEPARVCLELLNGASFRTGGDALLGIGLRCRITTDDIRRSYFITGGEFHVEKNVTMEVPFRALNDTGLVVFFVRSLDPIDHDFLDLATEDNVLGGKLKSTP